jgi:hypothetical protein
VFVYSPRHDKVKNRYHSNEGVCVCVCVHVHACMHAYMRESIQQNVHVQVSSTSCRDLLADDAVNV